MIRIANKIYLFMQIRNFGITIWTPTGKITRNEIQLIEKDIEEIGCSDCAQYDIEEKRKELGN